MHSMRLSLLLLLLLLFSIFHSAGSIFTSVCLCVCYFTKINSDPHRLALFTAFQKQKFFEISVLGKNSRSPFCYLVSSICTSSSPMVFVFFIQRCSIFLTFKQVGVTFSVCLTQNCVLLIQCVCILHSILQCVLMLYIYVCIFAIGGSFYVFSISQFARNFYLLIILNSNRFYFVYVHRCALMLVFCLETKI